MAGIGLLLDPVSENNLVGEPGFEGTVGDWALTATSWAASSFTSVLASYEGSTGRYAGRVTATKDATTTNRALVVTHKGMAVLPGVDYTAAIDLNVVNKGVQTYLSLQFFDAAGSFISSGNTAGFTGTGAKNLTFSKVAPANAVTAQIFWVTESNVSGDAIDIYVDSAEFGLTNGPLDINDGTKFRAMDFKAPPPPRKVNWSGNVDTDGSKPATVGYENRTLTITARVYGSSDADLAEQVDALQQKVAKVNSPENGTLQVTTPSGQTCVFDLLEGEADVTFDNSTLATRRAQVTITFTAAPFWRAGLINEIGGEDHVETTKPVIVGLDLAPANSDVAALGRLVIDEDQAQDQWTALWGAQSRNYDPSPDAELFYEAETREPMGGASAAALAGSSGSGSNTVQQGVVSGTYQAMLSTRKAGGGNHLRHVGTYRVFARLHRPTTNEGAVSVRLEWGEGDLRRRTLNEEVTFAVGEREGVFTIEDLGLVTLSKAAQIYAQRWEGRVLAKSTVAPDDLYVDWLFLMPVEDGCGEIKITPSAESPTTFVARDEFDQSAGNLDAPKAAPVGGNWAEAGKVGAEGFVVETAGHRAKRTIAAKFDADLNSGSYAISGASAITAQVVQADFSVEMPFGFFKTRPIAHLGVLGRYTDTNNWVKLVYELRTGTLQLIKRVAGTVTTIESESVGLINHKTAYTVRLLIDAGGRYFAWLGLSGSPLGQAAIIGQDSALATGGSLASGKVGIYHAWQTLESSDSYFDNFAGWVPVQDAAVFASQSLEVRSDRVLREDSGGTLLVRPTTYKGNYFRPSPARREGRSVRVAVKLSRNNIDTMPDTGIDDLSYRILWQTRGLFLPGS